MTEATYPNTPVIEMPMAVVCLVINLVLPGIGTIVSGVIGSKPMIGRGIFQFILTFILIGWIWALVTSIQLVTNAKAATPTKTA